MFRKIIGLIAVCGLALGATSQVVAANAVASYPNKPLRFIVGFPPGGVADIVARAITVPLEKELGQTIVLDNRAGAGGVIGVDAIARAEPDGYTLGFGVSGALTANVTLMPNLPYDPLKDIAPISNVVINPLVLVVRPTLGPRNLKEFIEYAKANPGVTYGTPGSGTAMNLAGELLNQMAGISLLHVAYKGSSLAVVDLLGGHLNAALVDLAGVKTHLDAGNLIALGTTGPQRTETAPDIPTFAEAGVPGYQLTSWFCLIMPAGTPPAIVNKVNAAVTKVLKDDEVKQRLLAAGVEPDPSTPEALHALIESDIRHTAEVIKTAGIPTK